MVNFNSNNAEDGTYQIHVHRLEDMQYIGEEILPIEELIEGGEILRKFEEGIQIINTKK